MVALPQRWCTVWLGLDRPQKYDGLGLPFFEWNLKRLKELCAMPLGLWQCGCRLPACAAVCPRGGDGRRKTLFSPICVGWGLWVLAVQIRALAVAWSWLGVDGWQYAPVKRGAQSVGLPGRAWRRRRLWVAMWQWPQWRGGLRRMRLGAQPAARLFV